MQFARDEWLTRTKCDKSFWTSAAIPYVCGLRIAELWTFSLAAIRQ
jgi:hypothetical protein